MATTTITWDCKTVDVYPTDQTYTDVVYNVHWRTTGTSSELDPSGNPYSATNIGTQTLSVDDITNFIPIEDLTNAEVEAWTKSAMGAENVTNIEESLVNQIALLITPTSITMQIGGGE
jgi:hypothetical protein